MILEKVKGKATCYCCGKDGKRYSIRNDRNMTFMELCGSCLWVLGSLINSQFKMDLP